MRFMQMTKTARFGAASLMGAALFGVAAEASAEVRRQGEWPDLDKKVTVDVTGAPRSQALKELAEAAGWSVMVSGSSQDPIDLHVKDQPAGKVLELILSDASYVASRDGSLIAIRRSDAAAPVVNPAAPPEPPELPEPPEPPAALAPPEPPAPPPPPPTITERGSDRVVTGHSLRIEAGEIVHDVAVFGGSVEVFGIVTGDLVVTGGSTRIHPGAYVKGDASTVGGSMTIDDGARVDGDIDVVGGSLSRGKNAFIGGEVTQQGGRGRRGGSHGHDSDDKPDEDGSTIARLVSDAAGAATRSALLFVFGAVLLALWPRRMEMLKVEVASRPMRSFALGIVGILGAAVLSVLLCVTVIGIPFAVVGMFAAILAAFAGLCSVLETVGGAAFGHRTKSPYMHLAAGCVMLLLIGAIPFVGGLVTLAAVLIGVGCMVSTRAAGLLPGKKATSTDPDSGHPYR